MSKQEEIANIEVLSIRCDCCGEMTDSFSDKSEWFGKYIKPEEGRICFKCIKDRVGYAQEFLEKIGVSTEALKVG